MKSVLKKIIPAGFIEAYSVRKRRQKVWQDFLFDYKRFVRYSASFGLFTREQKEALLIKEYHAVEKGLALRNPRPFFGLQRIAKLIDVLENYINSYGIDSTADTTISVLREYLAFSKSQQGNAEARVILDRIESITGKSDGAKKTGGTVTVTKHEMMSTLCIDYTSFVRSRHSVRDFSPEPVDRKLITEALELARFTPSVCNRQAWKVYLVDSSNPDLKRRFLEVQNGNRGFGEYIDTLLIVTGKLSSFFEYERSQVFIDGGMFAMSLVMALHSKGLGTCCLNTSYTSEKYERFLNVCNLDEDSVPIMFIGVGNIKDGYNVAYSDRKSLDKVLQVL